MVDSTDMDIMKLLTKDSDCQALRQQGIDKTISSETRLPISGT
jgi:hypothetical protein